MGPRTYIDRRLKILYEKFSPSEWFWLVSYSGGKDSTLLLLSVLSFARDKNFSFGVVYNDSGGDLPELRELSFRVLRTIESLGYKVYYTKPDKSFFDLLLTRYSPPRWNFRWCCKRLKEEPFRRLVYSLSTQSPILNLVGNRRYEARWRNWFIKKINDRIFYAAPLLDLRADEVWDLLKDFSKRIPELVFVYEELRNIYNGSDRSGCWFCPLIINDRFLEKRPELLRLKYQVFSLWCTNKRDELFELAKKYPNLIHVSISKNEIKKNYYPCKQKCAECQILRLRQNIFKKL